MKGNEQVFQLDEQTFQMVESTLPWSEPMFNLYKVYDGAKIALPNDTPVDITALPYNHYGREIQYIIQVSDFIAFNSYLREAEDIPSFMYNIASRTKWGGKLDWLIKLNKLLFAISNGVSPDKVQQVDKWILLLQDAWESLDDYGKAIRTYELYNDYFNENYGVKTKFIKGIKTSLKPDSFYKLYLKVEKEFELPEAKRTPQFTKTYQQIKPIIILMQKKKEFA